MEKESRSKPAGSGRAATRRTKQPEFDPAELEDLIFTPAVGSGVGSHLLQSREMGTAEPSQEPTTVDTSTVVDSKATTVFRNVEKDPQEPYIKDDTEPPTVVISEKPTVVDSELSTVVEPATEPGPATVDMSTVDMPASIPLWLTESGELVPASRVKRIRLAQDVLSPAEESVYDTLWGVKSAAAFKEPRENYRVVQAGYDFLMKRTRLSKKTIQRIVDRLIDKGFIAIEKAADIYLRAPTVYRVFAYRAVLDRQAQRGRFHVAKIGPGFVYVREVADPRWRAGDPTTVVDLDLPTVVDKDLSTEGIPGTTTGAGENATTVVAAATKEIEQGREVSAPSSGSVAAPRAAVEGGEVRELRTLLERHLGFIDDDATRQLLRQCRVRAADCSLEEIAYFVSHKLRSVNGIHNPVGFILTAVPRHFENHGHSAVRAFLREEEERRRRIWQEEYRYWRTVAEDGGATPEERAQAREVIDSLERSAGRPVEGARR